MMQTSGKSPPDNLFGNIMPALCDAHFHPRHRQFLGREAQEN
jgi:hypothetical protein